MSIIRINNRKFDFYITVGRFLSKRNIVDEIGHTLWDDDEKEWIVYVSKGEIYGFMTIEQKKDFKLIDCLYVIPEKRDNLKYEKRILIYGLEYLVKESNMERIDIFVPDYIESVFSDLGFIRHSGMKGFVKLTKQQSLKKNHN